jgi:hypothetical protein
MLMFTNACVNLGWDEQLVSDACDRFDPDSAFFQFPAEMRHMNIHGARLAVKVEAPGFLQELLATENESAVLGQGEEQIKFLGAQVDRPRGEAHFPPGRIHRQVTELDRGRVRPLPLPAPQDRFDARHQFVWVERLGQVIIGAKLQAQDLIDILIPGGQHQDRSRILRSPQTTANLEAIQFREHDVQHNQGGMLTGDLRERGFSIVRGRDPEAFAFS